MTIIEKRAALHALIDEADNRTLEAVYALMNKPKKDTEECLADFNGPEDTLSLASLEKKILTSYIRSSERKQTSVEILKDEIKLLLSEIQRP